jgi:hypothetical protein
MHSNFDLNRLCGLDLHGPPKANNCPCTDLEQMCTLCTDDQLV